MTTVLNKRGKRRRQVKSRITSGSEIHINITQREAGIMKLKPEESDPKEEVSGLVNNYSCNETKGTDNAVCFHANDKCLHCHKEYQNNSTTSEPVQGGPFPSSASVDANNRKCFVDPLVSRCGQVSNSTVSMPSNMMDSVCFNPVKISNNVANTCGCKSCLERRAIETEKLLENRLRHAWTQVRHLVRCAYHDPHVLASADSEEFKCYVDLLVSHDPHLLFCRIENTSREYVNDIKTRLLKQLTNGFNTPTLACSFINIMFDEYSHLLNSARTVSSLLRQLEEEHLSRFNHATWKQHNMHLFQSMVHSEPVIQRTFTEILNQLRQGSAQYDSKHDNLFTSSLIKYLKFDTEMTQISVAWRDIQKLIDDFHDERIEAKRKQCHQKSSKVNSEPKEKWEFYNIRQETYKQLLAKADTQPEDIEASRLSLTLRTCSLPDPSGNDGVGESKIFSERNGGTVSTSETDFPFDSPLNSEESFNEPLYVSQSPPTSTRNAMTYFSNDFLRDIRPPSVPSDDEDSSDNDDHSPRIVEHPCRLIPSDLDEEIDSIDSISSQPNASNLAPNPFLSFDTSSSNLLLNSAVKSYILPSFHHPPPYFPHQHLHHLHKTIHGGSDPIFSSGHTKPRPPSPNVKSKTESTCDPDPSNQLNILLPDPDVAPSLEIPKDVDKVTTSDASFNVSESSATGTKERENHASKFHWTASSTKDETISSSALSSRTLFGEGLYKDSWSSSSSSTQNCDSTMPTEMCSANATRHRHQKLKKKATRKHKGKSSNKGDAFNNSSKSSANTVASQGLTMPEKESNEKIEFDETKTREDSDAEEEEDADDEYDDDDDDIDNEEMCKCEKCIATINFCKVSDISRHYIPINEPKQQYMMQRLEPGISSGGASCECPSCLRLAAVSFFAAQSGQPSTNLVGLPQNSGTNISSQFYNSVQDLQSIIHPHLYGLPTAGDGGLFQPTEQPVFTTATDFNSNNDLQKSANLAEQSDKSQTGGDGGRSSASGHTLHHDSARSTGEWDAIGKSANAKLLATSQSGASSSLAEWPIPGHQAWLNGTGNCSGVLPSHLVAPGCVSAFQQYVNSSTITGTQGFLQPFLPGTGSLPHSGIHPASFLSAVENKGLHSSSSSNSVCVSANATTNPTAESHTTPFFTSSFSPSVTSNASTGSYAPSSVPSAFTPPSNMNYFSSSIYAPISDFSSTPHGPFSTQSHTAGGDPVHATTAAPVPQAVPPIRFHPGTSVSLKEGQFSLAAPGNVRMPSTSPLTPFSASDLQNTNIPQATQPLFTTTTSLNQSLCLQHNPFLQHNPISSGHNVVGYPNLLPQTSVGAQPVSNVLPQALPAGSTANNLHIRQQILRRKKLVAQSKLSRQVRPQQQAIKANEHPGGQEGNAQNNNQPSNLQKVRMQLQLTMQDKNALGHVPNSHSQAPEKLLPPTTSVGLSFAPPVPNSVSSHPQLKGKSPVEEAEPPTSSVGDRKQINKAPANATSINEKQITSSNTQPFEDSSHVHPPKHHHHPSESCQHLQGVGNEGCMAANSSNGNTTSTSTSTTNGGGSNNYKYCNCCYCEFFGNGGPPPAHTANNYLEVRDRLRRKLRTNKLKSNDGTEANTQDNGSSHTGLQGSLDELVTFIEGGEDGRKKSSKKVKQKQKKEEKRKNESFPAQYLIDKEPDSELTDGSGQIKGQPVLPKLDKEEKDLTDKDSLVDKDSSTESDLLRVKDPDPEKQSKKKKKQLKKANGQAVGEKKFENISAANASKSTSASSSQSYTLKEDSGSRLRKNPLAEKVTQDLTRTPTAAFDGKKATSSKGPVKKQADDKPQIAKSSVLKSSKESVSKSIAAKSSQDAIESPKANSSDIPEAAKSSGTKSSAGTIIKEKPTEKGTSQPKLQLEKVNLIRKVPQAEMSNCKSLVDSTVISNRVHAGDEDLVPFQPQKLKMSELRLRRLAPRNYNEEQRQHYLAAVKASSSANNDLPEQFKKFRQSKMSSTSSSALQSAERLLNQELRKRIIKAPPQSQPQRSAIQIRSKKTSISNFIPKETVHTNPSHRSQQQEKPAQLDQQRKKKPNTSQVKATGESNQEPTNNNTSGSSTPEKQNEGESADVKKGRARKQRKKNKTAQLAVGEGKGEVVDQVFLPRDVPEDDAKEMDDAEKEIESFKRFCLDSTVLNKPQKITVNWKDFAFKKNH